MAGVIVGAIALLLSGAALATKASKTSTEETLTAQTARIDAIETQARDAAAKAVSARSATDQLTADVQKALNNVSISLTQMDSEVKTLKESAAKKPAAGGGTTGPVVAGKDEYVVKSGDIGSKIAAATGFSVKAIEAVNPGIDWAKLKVGQKLKLPAKK